MKRCSFVFTIHLLMNLLSNNMILLKNQYFIAYFMSFVLTYYSNSLTSSFLRRCPQKKLFCSNSKQIIYSANVHSDNNNTNNYHIPVLLNECCEYLQVKPGGLYVDCTLGGGGHSCEILARGGSVIGFDQDIDAIKFASNRLNEYISNGKFEIIQSNFRHLYKILMEDRKSSLLSKHDGIDGILMDLGVSSYQINEPKRGFSFGSDGPLDMRMYQVGTNENTNTVSAFSIINNFTVTELADILYQYGEETRSRQIAREIVSARPLNTTIELVNVINRITPYKHRAKTLARCFQALRIYVNDELGSLKDALISAHKILKTDGRLVVMSYHSLEDRIVKNLFKYGSVESIENFENNSLNEMNPWSLVTNKAIMASEDEILRNKRSRSVKLRVGSKVDITNTSTPLRKSKYSNSFIGKKQLYKMSSVDEER